MAESNRDAMSSTNELSNLSSRYYFSEYGIDNNDWMRRPMGITHCLYGLEYLAVLDSIKIKHKIERSPIMGIEIANCYLVQNRYGENVYSVQELSDVWERAIYGHRRPFDMIVCNEIDQKILNFFHPLAYDYCCYGSNSQMMVVTTNTGQPLGNVRKQISILWPRFVVRNHMEKPIYFIDGPMCISSCCFCGTCYYDSVRFVIKNITLGREIGHITKFWTGCCYEFITYADCYRIRFPMEMDVASKALLLGACFLLDFVYFEAHLAYRSDYCYYFCNQT